MSNGQDSGSVQPQQTPDTPPAVASAPGMAAKEIEEGKAFALLSYVLGPFFLVPLIMRNNTFSLYHAKQCLVLWLAFVALMVVTGLPVPSIIGFFVFGMVRWVAGVALLVLCVMGLINASKGEAKELPVIGKYAEEWFKGVQKV